MRHDEECANRTDCSIPCVTLLIMWARRVWMLAAVVLWFAFAHASVTLHYSIKWTICALRNLTFRIHREASSSKSKVFVPPLTVEEQGCFFRTRTVQAPYREPPIPEPSRNACGVERLLQISMLGPLVYLMHNSTNPQTIEGTVWLHLSLLKRTSLYQDKMAY